MMIEDIDFYPLGEKDKNLLFEYIKEIKTLGDSGLRATIRDIILSDLWEEIKVVGFKLTDKKIKQWIDFTEEREIQYLVNEWVVKYQAGKDLDNWIDDDTYKDN